MAPSVTTWTVLIRLVLRRSGVRFSSWAPVRLPGYGAVEVSVGVSAGGSVGGAAVGAGATVSGTSVVVAVARSVTAASATWKAARVAASTSPVGGTPSSVWNAWSAAVSSSVHTPSIGPVQKPVSVEHGLNGRSVRQFRIRSLLAEIGQHRIERRCGGLVDVTRLAETAVFLQLLHRCERFGSVDPVDRAGVQADLLQLSLQVGGVGSDLGDGIGLLLVAEAASIGEQLHPCDLQCECGRVVLGRGFRQRCHVGDTCRDLGQVVLGLLHTIDRRCRHQGRRGRRLRRRRTG